MFKKIKIIIKKNPTLLAFFTLIWNLYNKFLFIFFRLFPSLFGMFLRKYNIDIFQRFNDILKYKNIHAGERCFIVCTGPSLTLEDIEKISKEISFGINSSIKLLKKTSWKPTYYGIVDAGVYTDLEHYILDALKKNEIKNLILPIAYKSKVLNALFFIKFKFPLPKETIFIPFSGIYPKTFFSGNAYHIVYPGSTVAHALLQVAVYMGFKEIYLIGADCDFTGEKQHFVEAEYDNITKINPLMGNYMINAYKYAKRYADKHGIKIYNATRGGKLEVFERVNLDEIL